MPIRELNLMLLKTSEQYYYSLIDQLRELWPGMNVMIEADHWKMNHKEEHHTRYAVWDGEENIYFDNIEQLCDWWNYRRLLHREFN